MMRSTLTILAVILASGSAGAADRMNGMLSDTAKAQLERGEPYVDVWLDKSRIDGAMDVLSTIDIQAPPSVIWNVMTDCARSNDIVENMESYDVIETAPDGSWDIREQKTKVNFMITSTSVFPSDYDHPHTIKISRVGGDMKVQDGFWTLSPLNDGITRVTYKAASAPKFLVPKAALQKAMLEGVPVILKKLREVAEADVKLATTK